jgi:hypothetical protein
MAEIGQQPARFDPVRSAAVTDTAHAVERLTDSSGLGWASHAEVKDATRRIAALGPQEADSVVDELAQRGKLDQLVSEVMDGLGSGLSADERADFMKSMAERLDGQSLAALSAAFARHDPATGGYEQVTELAGAVARHASADARLAYVGELATQTTDRPHHGVGFMQFDGQRRLGDAEARAIAEVITSFNGDAASTRAALASVQAQPGAMDAVMTAAMNTEQDWGLTNGWHTASADRSTFRALMQTTSAMELSEAGGLNAAAARALGDGVFNAAARVIDPRDIEAADLVQRPTPMSAEATQMARIADAVYAGKPAPAGTERLSNTELGALGLNPALLSKPDIGFEAGLYRLDDGSYVLGFRGTDDWGAKLSGDLDDNALQGLGLGSLQYSAATIAGMEVARAVGSENLQITGHSLGGGLAAAASGRTGVPATTFNAAGLAAESQSAYTLNFAPGQVTNYRTTGDILSYLNGGPAPTKYADLIGLNELRDFPAAVGTQIDLGNPLARVYLDQQLNSWWPGTVLDGGKFGGNQHLMGEVLRHAGP